MFRVDFQPVGGEEKGFSRRRGRKEEKARLHVTA